MTKTDYTGQGVDDLRASLLELFEDEDGAIAVANKTQLVEFARDNWDYIDSVINAVEETPDEGTTEGEDQETLDEDPVVVAQPENVDLSKPNPKTDLYSGRLE